MCCSNLSYKRNYYGDLEVLFGTKTSLLNYFPKFVTHYYQPTGKIWNTLLFTYCEWIAFFLLLRRFYSKRAFNLVCFLRNISCLAVQGWTPRTTPRIKWIYILTSNFADAKIGLRTCPSLMCCARILFQMKIRKISHRCSHSPKYPELGHFTLLFCRGPLRNVPLIEPLNLFVTTASKKR